MSDDQAIDLFQQITAQIIERLANQVEKDPSQKEPDDA